jgi:plasmid stability protein
LILRRPVQIVYAEQYSSREEARRRERQIKRWSSEKKELLVRGDLAALSGSSQRARSFRHLTCVDMQVTCAHATHMSKMVQIRNVPDSLHRKLKARAADSGRTLSDYLLTELERLAARPTREDMLARLHSRKRVTLKTPAAVVIREERESV